MHAHDRTLTRRPPGLQPVLEGERDRLRAWVPARARANGRAPRTPRPPSRAAPRGSLVHHVDRRHRTSLPDARIRTNRAAGRVMLPAGRRCRLRRNRQRWPGGPTVREYSVPATRRGDEENLVDAVFDNAARHANAVVYRRASGRRPWSDVTAARVRRRRSPRSPAGLIAAGVGRGPGRPAVPHPLRVDAVRLRRSWPPAASPCRSTRRPRPSRSSGSCPTPARSRSSSRPASTASSSTASPARCPTLRRIWQIERAARRHPGAVDELVALGADVAADEVDARRRGRSAPTTWPR